jgi:hypothetical protein
MAAALEPEWTPVFGEHGSLRELHLDGQQVIRPWGMETADARAFFSLETGGWGSQVLHREVARTPTSQETSVTVRMAEGLWRAKLTDSLFDRGIVRLLSYTAEEDTWAMDLVMRFAFRRQAVRAAEIAGRTITWDGANLYYQYEVRRVLLRLDRRQLRISVRDREYPPEWRLSMYVRCSPTEDAWVVHVRLLPSEWRREIIKLRWLGSRHFVFPERVSGGLLRIGPLARHLRYAGEQKRLLGSRLNAYPLLLIPRGTVIELKAEAELL